MYSLEHAKVVAEVCRIGLTLFIQVVNDNFFVIRFFRLRLFVLSDLIVFSLQTIVENDGTRSFCKLAHLSTAKAKSFAMGLRRLADESK
jgi:hypothetical protein